MDGNWWSRFAAILFVALIGVYALLPTFVGESAEERNQRKIEGEEVAAATADWHEYLPDTRLNLGIDLQGGIDLTLDVELEEAVLSTVSRDVLTIRDAAEREGVQLADLRRVRGEPSLEIRPGEGSDLDALREFFNTRFNGYEYSRSEVDEAGVEWHRFSLTEDEQERIGVSALEQAVETLRTRVDATGVKEPSITQKGNRRINVQLPGAVDLEDAVAALGTTAVLEFFLVDEDFDDAALERAIADAKATLDPEIYNDDIKLNDWLVDNGKIGRNNKVLWEYTTDKEGNQTRQIAYALIDEVMLTGDDVNDAAVGMDEYNRPVTSLEFKPRGAQIFAEVTGANIKKRFAIVLDNKVRSAPTIQDRIAGGRAQITMGSGDYNQMQRESQTLALVLRTGALPAPISIAEVRTIGPSLGKDSVEAGFKATMLGAILVVLSMALYYRKAGIVADVALALNVLLVLALLAGFGATLTLPGIAGIALTVGMAVDANIIIYERIREELRLGKSTRASVEAGYEFALSAVLDANITTGIAGIVLYSYGTGPIKGFAVTLLIGILTTLFTALFVSRTLIDLVASKSDSRLVY
ncbi:MAG: protein translocase subunit SecD [Alphaproteobacteria bacterium]|nr:protein translocase subunit SecD [Alphaproteobacteria bacterium]MCB9791655.1 protein translocase subunit SecD [Alphaproteobacteria bacterium]